ncbi:hypothetical protein FS837_008394 [Tulasnella sp. UAMH 9824]|nr:hypothetical protein FS837_008394 [Tulasnella sp. UAMH 9824]
MASVWIIVWDDGTLSHNLPSNIATQVDEYCQIQHSLKLGSNQQNPAGRRPQQTGTPQNSQPGTGASAQKQQSSTSSANTASNGSANSNAGGTVKLSWVQILKGNKTRMNAAASTSVAAPPVTASTSTALLPASTSSQPIFEGPAPTSLPAAAPAPQAPSTVKAVPAAKLSTKAKSRKSKAREKADLAEFADLSLEPSLGWGDISSIFQGVSAEPELYVLPKKLSTTLRLLDPFVWPDSVEYEKVTRLFEDGWKHQHKRRPKIKRILAVGLPDHLKETYEAYKRVKVTLPSSEGV